MIVRKSLLNNLKLKAAQIIRVAVMGKAKKNVSTGFASINVQTSIVFS
jgi:hypothetical protein